MDAKLQSAMDILKEFMADVEAVGVDRTLSDWPDLHETYQHAAVFFEPPGKSVYMCGNCQQLFRADTVGIKWLINIEDLNERLDPGGVVPDCECPFCGALAYKVKRKQKETCPKTKTKSR